MSEIGKTHIVVMWTVGPDDVEAGDRVFESHGKWMTGHSRDGDTALLDYSISKGRQIQPVEAFASISSVNSSEGFFQL
jgi:hypothetical protein